MSDTLLLTFNAGSSSVKIGLFEGVTGAARRLGLGTSDLRRAPLRLNFQEGQARRSIELRAPLIGDLHEVLDETLAWLGSHLPLDQLALAGHRVVHGGDAFAGPALIDDATLERIEALVPLAPLHQPECVRLIRAVRHVRPELTQAASFDTAFHRTLDDLARRFALPRALFDAGIKRYGFHGLSYQFVSRQLRRQAPQWASGRVIAAHLGSGASLCALHDGVSRDTSMGFSTLDGVPMATRCGTLDAGVVLHLYGEMHMTQPQVEDLLYRKSGLLGVSSISADSRALLASDRPEAREALDLFALRVASEIARLAVILGGLDAIVFTAGIGEHQAQVRANICARLAWLGVELDADANRRHDTMLSTLSSPVAVLIIPTDEEQVIADEALALASAKEGSSSLFKN